METAQQHTAIELQAVDLKKSWGKCGDSANYIASYMAHEFQNPDKALNIISVVLNELLEYLFDACEIDSSIFISLSLEEDSFSISCQTKLIPELECQQYIEHAEKLQKDDWITESENPNHFRFAFLIQDYECNIQFQQSPESDTIILDVHVPS